MKNVDIKEGQTLEEWLKEIAEGDKAVYEVLRKVSVASYCRGSDAATEIWKNNQPK